jgi:hypothetical protein
MIKISGKAATVRVREDLKSIGIYTWLHAYRHYHSRLCLVALVALRMKLTNRIEDYGLDLSTVLLPWEKRTRSFKSAWCSRAIQARGFTTLAMTLRLGNDQVERCDSSPYGFTHAFGRRLRQQLNPAEVPFWFVTELQDKDREFCPHIHGVIGLPKKLTSSPSSPLADVEVVKMLLRDRGGDFCAARAVKLEPLYLPIPWSGYCSKQIASTEKTTGRSPFYIPHTLLADGRALYNANREDMISVFSRDEPPSGIPRIPSALCAESPACV